MSDSWRQANETALAVLSRRYERSRQLVADRADWEPALSDGVEDLVADVRHDLSERFRALHRDVEGVIDRGDPKATWPDLEAWLQRQLAGVATANYDLLSRRAEELAADVAEYYRLESEVPLDLGLTAPDDVLRGLWLDRRDVDDVGSRWLTRVVVAGRAAVVIPYVVLGVIGSGSLLLLVTLGPLSLLLGIGIGRRLLRGERERHVTHQRQQAKIAVRRYLDEAAFVIGRDCQDLLRRTRRELRDEFRTRAALLWNREHPGELGGADLAAEAERRLQRAERRAREAERRAVEAERRVRDAVERAGRQTDAGHGAGASVPVATTPLLARPPRALDRINSWMSMTVPAPHRPRYADEFTFELHHLAARGASRRAQWAHVVRVCRSLPSLRRELRKLSPAAERA